MNSITEIAKGTVNTVANAATAAAKNVSDRLDQSECAKFVKEGVTKAAGALSDVGSGISTATDKALSNISGAEALQQIQELVAQQRRYNDVLATRLAEALDRIDQLEAQVSQLTDGR